MPQDDTYKSRLFRRLTETCASLPDAVLIKTFGRFSSTHSQLLLSLMPMSTISRLSYLVDPAFFESLPAKEIPEPQAIKVASELLDHFNDLCLQGDSEKTLQAIPDRPVTTSVKILDFIARRMGRLTIKP